MSLANILNTDNPVFRGFIFYNSVLVVKMMAMSVLTAIQRVKNKVINLFLTLHTIGV